MAIPAAVWSDITFIDGENGILRYRGIPIEQFATSPNFVEVAWLLIFGLPTAAQYTSFADDPPVSPIWTKG